MHDINPRVRLLPDCRGEHIKLKLLACPSRWTYALWHFWPFPKKIGPSTPHRRPEYREHKNLKWKHCVSPRTQIMSIYSGEHIKRNLLINPSKIKFPLSLKLIISAKKLGSKGENLFSKSRRKTYLWNSCPQLSNPEIIENGKSGKSIGRMQHVL